MKKIILLGYMGSGKTVIGTLLAKQTNLQGLDLDQIIEKETGSSITSIFEQHGEIYFRKLEHRIFSDLMQSQQSFVLSLGGGTPCYAGNHEMLKGQGVVSVYLRTSIQELFRRLLPEQTHRPLIANMEADEMKDFIAKSLFERSYFYNQAMHMVVTDGKTPQQVVSEIEKLL